MTEEQKNRTRIVITVKNLGNEIHGNWIQTTIAMYFKPNTIFRYVASKRENRNRQEINDGVVEGSFCLLVYVFDLVMSIKLKMPYIVVLCV